MAGQVMQFTAVAIGTRGILIDGPSGSGKSSLALALIDRGATLIGDDGVSLEEIEGNLWAAPVPATEGMIEIRNLGVVRKQITRARIALKIDLDTEAPRYIEKAGSWHWGDHSLPSIALYPDLSVMPLRVEHALGLYAAF